jgi:hypothetical protein
MAGVLCHVVIDIRLNAVADNIYESQLILHSYAVSDAAYH